jgi:flagellar motor protein MotB
LTVDAKGSADPAQPTAEGVREPLNRRVEILITCP